MNNSQLVWMSPERTGVVHQVLNKDQCNSSYRAFAVLLQVDCLKLRSQHF